MMQKEVQKQAFEKAIQSGRELDIFQCLKQLVLTGFTGEEIFPFLEKTRNISVVNNVLTQLYTMNYPDLREKMRSEQGEYTVPSNAQHFVLTAIQLKIINKGTVESALNQLINLLNKQYRFQLASEFQNVNFPTTIETYLKLLYVKFIEKVLAAKQSADKLQDFLIPKSGNVIQLELYKKTIQEVFPMAMEAGDDDILLDYLLDKRFGYNKEQEIVNSMKEIMQEKLLKKIAYNISLDRGDELVENLRRIERLGIGINLLQNKTFEKDTYMLPEKVSHTVLTISQLQKQFLQFLTSLNEAPFSRPRSLTNASTRSSFSYMSSSSSLEKSIDRTLYKRLIIQHVNQPHVPFSELVDTVMGNKEQYNQASQEFIEFASTLPLFQDTSPRKSSSSNPR